MHVVRYFINMVVETQRKMCYICRNLIELFRYVGAAQNKMGITVTQFL